MISPGDEDSPFPADARLFEDTFCQESVFRLLGQEVQVQQRFGAQLGVAAPVWDSALNLCRFLEERRVDLRGRRVIELGAGTGVVGIAAALRGAAVTLTDLPLVLPQLQSNVSANAPAAGWPHAPPAVLPLTWGRDHRRFSSDWDLVLGADIVYLPETYPLLLETLVHLCRGDARLYLASKMREEHGTPGFFGDILPGRFDVELVDRDRKQNINIYRASLRNQE